MRRADRLFQIVQYLRAGRLMTARTLGERLEVSERTIYRDIADLQASGVPIDGEAGIGYLMRAGYDLPPLMFTREEMTALVVGARIVRAWGGAQMALAAEEALVKIEAVLPEAERRQAADVPVYAFDYQMQEVDRRNLDRLNEAIAGRVLLDIDYEDVNGDATRRHIEPLSLFFWGKVWTLVAWCRLRQDFRMFRVDRIRRLEATGETVPRVAGRTLQDFLARMVATEGIRLPPGAALGRSIP
ncbi:MAG: DNA-binding transcriptional regulator [Alphaproteobacteria bacterium]|nr:MAG: DNA-binding transcriptional regulator [Alphaproteobacteria bacterium]